MRVRIRFNDENDILLIKEEHVAEFDRLRAEMDEVGYNSDEFYDVCDEIDTLINEYGFDLEGDITDAILDYQGVER